MHRLKFPRRLLPLITALLLSTALLFPAAAPAEANREILWDIVSHCLDPAAADYDKLCRWPVENSAAACRNTIALWDKNSEFVILRDRKMCNCLDNKTFVHGLAIPRAKVTGAEDPNRPSGIWQFAWDNAVKKIGNESEIALLVNPPGEERSQDQLHVHLLRLNKAGKRLIAESHPPVVKNLADVWSQAEQTAREKGFKIYGVLVARHQAGGFAVIADNSSLEDLYTEARCSQH